jgi:hypothetical protein
MEIAQINFDPEFNPTFPTAAVPAREDGCNQGQKRKREEDEALSFLYSNQDWQRYPKRRKRLDSYRSVPLYFTQN